MSDLRERYKKETGNKVGAIVDFECEYCGVEDGIEGWSDDYVFWLEKLANGATTGEKQCNLPVVVGQSVQLFCDDCNGKINELDAYCKHCGEVIS